MTRKAGDHLLSLLKAEGSVPYSRFYDGEDVTHDRLREALGLEDDWYSPEVLMDVAAAQFEKAGLVTIEPLAAKLADDEQDYRISLTDEGRAFLASSKPFPYRDVDL
jgi:hypothetical protein